MCHYFKLVCCYWPIWFLNLREFWVHIKILNLNLRLNFENEYEFMFEFWSMRLSSSLNVSFEFKFDFKFWICYYSKSVYAVINQFKFKFESFEFCIWIQQTQKLI